MEGLGLANRVFPFALICLIWKRVLKFMLVLLKYYQAVNETVEHCYKPMVKECNDIGNFTIALLLL